MMFAMPAVNASMLWEMLPNDVQLACYDSLLRYMPERCKEAGLDFDKAFPAPAGLEEYRRQMQALQAEARTREQLKGGRRDLAPAAPGGR